MANKKPSVVLYQTHNGTLSPISHLYYATASRHLSSSLSCPPTTLLEIDSAYCPQCLAFYDANTAFFTHNGRCTNGCCSCPLCGCNLTIVFDSDNNNNNCFYKCGYCRYTSEECGIRGKLMDKGTLIASLYARIRQQYIGEFSDLVDLWKSQERKQLYSNNRRSSKQMETTFDRYCWNVETLEAALVKKKKKKLDTTIKEDGTIPRLSIGEINCNSNTTIIEKLCVPHVSAESFARQCVLSTCNNNNNNNNLTISRQSLLLLPIPMSLRARTSRRCRAELAAGRPGILVKPKMNPLEGDTSLRSGHGQWWKKDSSAIHAVPKVQVLRCTSQSLTNKGTVRYNILFRVQNPTLGDVRLRFSSSPNLVIPPVLLKNILINSITLEKVNATLLLLPPCDDVDSSSSTMKHSETMTLEAVQDAFLELGKGTSRVPPEVEEWNPTNKTTTATTGSCCCWNVVSQHKDKAWIELQWITSKVVDYVKEEVEYGAIPFQMQMDIGNGSWESALIQPKDDEKDNHVTFTLVAIV